MPKSKYMEIYQTIKSRIEEGEYSFRHLLRSDYVLFG